MDPLPVGGLRYQTDAQSVWGLRDVWVKRCLFNGCRQGSFKGMAPLELEPIRLDYRLGFTARVLKVT